MAAWQPTNHTNSPSSNSLILTLVLDLTQPQSLTNPLSNLSPTPVLLYQAASVKILGLLTTLALTLTYH